MAETGFDELQDQWEDDEQRLRIRVTHLEETEIEKTFKELRGSTGKRHRSGCNSQFKRRKQKKAAKKEF